ncbi:MAG: TIGR02646 family protein [Deltaproteobacteria bacterium]|nr:TIGR02646 family protein [Deltaproteobacteria bacterium]
MTSDQKQEMRESTFREQGGLCAYCMSKLSGSVAADDQDPAAGGMKIEHFAARHAQNTGRNRMFDWQNLLGVCPGDTAGPRRPKEARFHCDNYRGNAPLGANPAGPPPASELFRYTNAGEIRASQLASSAAQLNIDALNLNHPRLKSNRKAVIERTRKILKKHGWKRAVLEKYRRLATARDQDGCLQEFCGAIAYYLDKKIRADV